MPISEITKTFNICKNTVDNWIQWFINTGDCSSQQSRSRQPPYKFNDKQAIIDFLLENSDADGIMIRDAVAPTLAMSTFYDTLARLKITYKKRAKIRGA